MVIDASLLPDFILFFLRRQIQRASAYPARVACSGTRRLGVRAVSAHSVSPSFDLDASVLSIAAASARTLDIARSAHLRGTACCSRASKIRSSDKPAGMKFRMISSATLGEGGSRRLSGRASICLVRNSLRSVAANKSNYRRYGLHPCSQVNGGDGRFRERSHARDNRDGKSNQTKAENVPQPGIRVTSVARADARSYPSIPARRRPPRSPQRWCRSPLAS